MWLVSLLVLSLVAPVLTAALGGLRTRLAPPAAVILQAAAFVLSIATVVGGEDRAFSLRWIPMWDAHLVFAVDGLASIYLLLVTGIGLAVIVYSLAYLPAHLREQGRPMARQTRFHVLLLSFSASMVGLVTARDLLLVFVFFDLTAICSYFLIGFDREEASARRAALMALLVTGIPSVALLVALLLVRAATGTLDITSLGYRVGATAMHLPAILILFAALAKSAQTPFHFWLPRAMAAPTPVSAYLHSAAMVAAGVFLVARLRPLLTGTWALDALPVMGLLSIAVGSVMALRADGLKELLAYSTVAQYGYVMVLLGLGGAQGAAGAALYVAAHGLAKSGLFMTAGAVVESTGAHTLSRTGGLARQHPWLAAASALCAASLAGLPLTLGYFKDEAFFQAALAAGGVFPVVVVLAAAATLAYTLRFWTGIFWGPRPDPEPESSGPAGNAEHGAGPGASRPLHPVLVAPIVVLAGLGLLGGLAGSEVTSPFIVLAERAGRATLGHAISFAPSYHLLHPATAMALCAYAAGGLLFVVLSRLARRPPASVRCTARLGRLARSLRGLGPEAWYTGALAWLARASSRMRDIEVRDLRDRVAAILLPAGVLLLIALARMVWITNWRVGPVFGFPEARLGCLLLLAAALAVVAARQRRHLPLMLSLSGIGYALAVVYALLGAPDVALVAVLVETTFTLLFLGFLALLPPGMLRAQAERSAASSLRWQSALAGIAGGAVAFALVWATLSGVATRGVAGTYANLAPLVHAHDAVGAILTDFRGLDTAGEMTVLAISLVGVIAHLRSRRQPRKPRRTSRRSA